MWTQDFYNASRKLITPKLEYSQNIYEKILRKVYDSKNVWLDLGCGHQLLSPWRKKEEKKLVEDSKMFLGLDYELNSLKKHQSLNHKIRGDIKYLPLKSNTLNLITANMVIEHLQYPEEQLSEVNRVLKPGGRFIFHTPNKYGYSLLLTKWIPDSLKQKLLNFLENRKAEDVFKTYYRLNTTGQIKKIIKKTGFKIEEINYIASTPHFSKIPPLLIFELFFIRLLLSKAFKLIRPNLIVSLIKN
jgi:ubiquinone/menaquinone biosynthesis C-methylase UbiE